MRHGHKFSGNLLSMTSKNSRLSRVETIAIITFIVALLGIAAVLIVPAYPNASGELFRWLLWGCVAVAALSFLFVVWHHLARAKLTKRPIILIVALLVAGFTGVLVMWGYNFFRHTDGPKLEGNIVYTILGKAPVDGKIVPGVFIFAAISNTGTVQSAVTGFRVSAKKDGSLYQGVILAPVNNVTVQTIFPEINSNQTIIIHKEDALYSKSLTPIQPGGVIYGFLVISFPNLVDYTVLSGGFEIDLTFFDAFSKRYDVIQSPRIVTRRIPKIVLPGMQTEYPD